MSESTSLRTALPRPGERLPLGEGGLLVSPFCLGVVRDEDAILAAFDAGINFFFVTADMHWPIYEKCRRGLKKLLARGGIRDQIVIGAVSYATQPEFCSYPFQEVLAEVPALERLDVLIAGGAYAREILLRLSVYQRHKRASFLGARAIGATFHERQAALLAVNHDLVDIAFSRCNPTHPGDREGLYPFLKAPSKPLLYNFLSTVGYVPPARRSSLGVDERYWQPKVTDYYRFALTHAALDGLLCAPGTPDEVEALVRALEEGPLDAEEEQFLLDLADLDKEEAELLPPPEEDRQT